MTVFDALPAVAAATVAHGLTSAPGRVLHRWAAARAHAREQGSW